MGGFSGEDVELGVKALVVAQGREFDGAAGGADGERFLGAFGFQDAHGGEIVFDALERGQHGLAVGGDLGVVGGAGLVGDGAALASVKEGLGELRANGPDAARPVDERADGGTGEAGGGGDSDRRVESRDGDADLRVGGGHSALGGGDVGAALQEFRG